MAAGTCQPERHLAHEAKPVSVGGCTPQASISGPSLGYAACSKAQSQRFSEPVARWHARNFQFISLHYPWSVDTQKSSNSSCGVLIGIGCVLISKR